MLYIDRYEPDCDDCVNIKSAALSVDQRVYLSTNEDGDSGHVGTCCSSVVKLQAKVDGQKSECMAMPHHVSDLHNEQEQSVAVILRSRSDLSYSDKRFYCIEVRPLAATRSVNVPSRDRVERSICGASHCCDREWPRGCAVPATRHASRTGWTGSLLGVAQRTLWSTRRCSNTLFS